MPESAETSILNVRTNHTYNLRAMPQRRTTKYSMTEAVQQSNSKENSQILRTADTDEHERGHKKVWRQRK